MVRAYFLVAIFSLLLGGCATPYAHGSGGPWGGLEEQELESGVWRLRSHGNSHTTRETVQTYWLYRAAELTLEKGFDGFEILSSVPLSDDFDRFRSIRVAANGIIFIPMPAGRSNDRKRYSSFEGTFYACSWTSIRCKTTEIST